MIFSAVEDSELQQKLLLRERGHGILEKTWRWQVFSALELMSLMCAGYLFRPTNTSALVFSASFFVGGVGGGWLGGGSVVGGGRRAVAASFASSNFAKL